MRLLHVMGTSSTSCSAASGALLCVWLGCGSLVAEFGRALLQRHYDLVLGLGELGLGTRFGALRGVVPHGHGGGERKSAGRM